MAQIVITGGSGLLGRALVARLSPDHDLTVVSRSEKTQLGMRAQYPSVRFVLGDVCDRALMARTIAGQDVVIHAAALKHVPISEAEPTAYVTVNVLGSLSVLDAAMAAGVKVVGISTDKACAPRNVYGASKFLMERVLTEQGQIAIRYGNVFASDGSVVVKWQQQLKDTGTITVTNPDMTRFFFRIDDAVDEILWAMHCAPVGTVVVPNLRAVRLGDLADACLYHAGGGTVTVVGPRPGEKPHESLLTEDEGAYAVRMGNRVILRREPSAKPVPAMTSDAVERVTRKELLAWLN